MNIVSDGAEQWLRAYGTLSGISVAFNLVCIACSTMLIVQVNLMLNEQLKWFIEHHDITYLNFLLFLIAMLSLLGLLAVNAIKLYGLIGLVTCIIVACALLILGFYFFRLDKLRIHHAAALMAKKDREN